MLETEIKALRIAIEALTEAINSGASIAGQENAPTETPAPKPEPVVEAEPPAEADEQETAEDGDTVGSVEAVRKVIVDLLGGNREKSKFVRQTLQADYGVNNMTALSLEQANELLAKLREVL